MRSRWAATRTWAVKMLVPLHTHQCPRAFGSPRVVQMHVTSIDLVTHDTETLAGTDVATKAPAHNCYLIVHKPSKYQRGHYLQAGCPHAPVCTLADEYVNVVLMTGCKKPDAARPPSCAPWIVTRLRASRSAKAKTSFREVQARAYRPWVCQTSCAATHTEWNAKSSRRARRHRWSPQRAERTSVAERPAEPR